jgi:CRISPR-associated endonuclease Csy4
MRITIDYNASWNGLVTQEDKKKYREQIGFDTVKGVLFRLIGDVRQLKDNSDTHWMGVAISESNVRFKVNLFESQEDLIAIRGKNGSTGQKCAAFLTADISSNPLLHTKNNPVLAGFMRIAHANDDQLYAYITQQTMPDINVDDYTLEDLYSAYSSVEDKKISDKLISIATCLPALKGENGNPKKPTFMRFLALALYDYVEKLQHDEILMLKKEKLGFEIVSGKGFVKGVSKNGSFTLKDFGESFYALPNAIYLKPEHIYVESGQLVIDVDTDEQSAKSINQAIKNAGVMTFHLGRKGLAYVSSIDTHNYWWDTNSMLHYVEIDLRKDKSEKHGVLMARFMAKAHIRIVEMFKQENGSVKSKIGFGFPLYSQEKNTLGGVVRAFGDKSSLASLFEHTSMTDYLGAILTVPDNHTAIVFNRKINTKSEAKLRRLMKRQSLTQEEIKNYRIKMIQNLMDYPFVDLQSHSNINWFRLYVSLSDTSYDDCFDSYGLGAKTPVF